MPQNWLITGVGTGLGQALATAALAQGDTVAGILRKPAARDAFNAFAPGRAIGLLADVADPVAVAAAVRAAEGAMGGIDILVNNAAQVLEATVEEADAAEVRALFAVNFHGPLNTIQAVLPAMRARKAGHIVNISSAGGMIGLAALGIYCASKFALEGLSEALAAEVGPLGIRVTIVEPGSFRTNLLIGSTTRQPMLIDAYEQSCGPWRRTLAGMAGREPNDPERFAEAILALVAAAHPPLRLPLGRDALGMIDGKLESVRQDIAPWREMATTMAFADSTWYVPAPVQSQTS